MSYIQLTLCIKVRKQINLKKVVSLEFPLSFHLKMDQILSVLTKSFIVLVNRIAGELMLLVK